MLLYNNINNRPLRKQLIQKYANEMKNGTWEQNGQPIVFGKNGILKDGQHRLNAVVLSGVSTMFLIVTDVNDNVSIFDCGAKRTIPDLLKFKNYEPSFYSSNTVAMIRHIMYMKNCDPYSGSVLDDVEKFILKYHDQIIAAVKICINKKIKGVQFHKKSSFSSAVFFAICNGVDHETLENFVDSSSSGFYNDDCETSAIVIRNQIINGDIYTDNRRDKIHFTHCVENAIYDYVRKFPRKKYYNPTNGMYSSVFYSKGDD